MKGQRLISFLSVVLSLAVLAAGAPRTEAGRAGAGPSPAGERASGEKEQKHAGRQNSAAAESEQAKEQARALSVPVEAAPSGAAEPRAPGRGRIAPAAAGGTNAAATFTVNSDGDDDDEDTSDGVCKTKGGVCTLRAAIQTANATAGVSTIAFDIPGDGVHTIDVGSTGLGALPTIGTVMIDGYTQPGSSPNSLVQGSNAVILIELNGTSAGAGALGLNLSGGNSMIRGLVINRFKGSGIQILSGGGNKVQGCFIGTDAAGKVDLGNGQVGVFITLSSDNTIGGENTEDRNVISGNGLEGIQISQDSQDNKVLRNLIGTDASGDSDLGNSSSGVSIFDSDSNIIGGNEPRLRNVISGNDTHGVQIVGNGPIGSGLNRVVGNFIGTDRTGLVDLGNTSLGVAIFNSSFNAVGGFVADSGNVISGNDIHGVQITGNSPGNSVSGNLIGTDAPGTADLGNGATGVAIFSSNSTVGGTAEAERNVISGNDQHGVAISGGASLVKVEGNFIGTSKDGTADLGNSQEGVAIFNSPTNTIGGQEVGEVSRRNVISGNNQGGVLISGAASTGNLVEDNFIGTDLTGTLDRGNTLEGVFITAGARGNTVGGPGATFRNLISGNDGIGVVIDGAAATEMGPPAGTTLNRVEGNVIGVTLFSAELPNLAGVRIHRSSNNTVGGPAAAQANDIIRNARFGVEIDGVGATDNRVLGNDIIGAPSPAEAGVIIRNGATGNFVGGPGARDFNRIIGNRDGVEITGAGTTGNKVRGNFIRDNANDGVAVRDGASDNAVGGTAAGEGNEIRDNGGDGVEINGAGATANAILSNSIHSNGELGIDLDPVNGVNPNDAGDSDAGPNNKQNFPVLNAPANLFGFTVITGTLNSTAATKFRVEIFSSPACDPSNHGEGQKLIGALDDVTTDSNGNRNFDLSLPALPAGHFVTATATNTSLPPSPQNTLNNTSEFSMCVQVPSVGTFGVNTTEDTDDGACTADNCSLREAIRAANADPGADVINLGEGAAGQLNLSSPLPDLASNITINGPGANLFTVRRNAGGDYRIFHVLSGHTVTLSGLTISNGKPADGGGGILNDGGTLTILNCIVSGNSTGAGGGGVSNHGGTLSVADSTVSGNAANGGGGGISNSANGTATITNSTVSGNITSGNRGGGIFNSQSSLTLQRSTVSGNSTGGNGGDNPGGGGIHHDGGTLTLTGSTVSHNRTAGDGGGVHNAGPGAAGLRNSIVANNSAGVTTSPVAAASGSGPDLSGAFNSLDFNLIGSTSGATITGATANNLTGVDPKLAPLADNGGPTQTHALQAGSPAIDRGDCSGSATDQRGLPCPFDDPAIPNAGDGGDIGAFEAQTAAGPGPALLQFAQASHGAGEGLVPASVTVTRSGDASAPVTVDFATSDGTASERSDYTTALGTLHFAAGVTSADFDILINDDSFAEGTETVNLTLSNPTGGASLGAQATATLQITDDAAEPPTNVIDDAAHFTAQHYHDFLNRQHDPPGHLFWTREITSCGTDGACISRSRENVSAAFFLSIEFQETGYRVIHTYKSTFTDSPQRPRGLPRYREFLRDAREMGRGVVVGVGDWEQRLAANTLAFASGWVQRPDVLAQFPADMTAAQFVDKLFMNSEVTPTQSERDAGIAAFGAGGVEGRAAALLSVTASAAVYNRQFNCAFVLMQYFGYLRRNPDDAPDGNFGGFDFWLNKLDSFSLPGEDLRDADTALRRVRRAEMIKAFLDSVEYRGRFGPTS